VEAVAAVRQRRSLTGLSGQGGCFEEGLEFVFPRNFNRSTALTVVGVDSLHPAGNALRDVERPKLHIRGPDARGLSVHQAPIPTITIDSAQQCSKLFLGASIGIGVPLQDGSDHDRKHRSQEGLLRHVLHLLHKQNGCGRIVLGDLRLRIRHVFLVSNAASKVVCTAKQEKGHSLVWPLRRFGQLHGTTAIDANSRRNPVTLVFPQDWQDHLPSPGAEDEAVALVSPAMKDEVFREGMQIGWRLAILPVLGIAVVWSPRATHDVEGELRVLA